MHNYVTNHLYRACKASSVNNLRYVKRQRVPHHPRAARKVDPWLNEWQIATTGRGSQLHFPLSLRLLDLLSLLSSSFFLLHPSLQHVWVLASFSMYECLSASLCHSCAIPYQPYSRTSDTIVCTLKAQPTYALSPL